MNIDKAETAEALSVEDIRRCFPVMHQLRPHLTDEDAFIEQIQRQFQEGYRLAYLQDDGKIKAVTGFRFMEFLAWGKVLYIDDLVTDSESRKKGHARQLLQWVIEQAKIAKCNQVHLDSNHQRYDAHRLYLNQGFKIICHHFALDC